VISARLFILGSIVSAVALLPAPSRATPAPGPTFEGVASQVTAIPAASAVDLLRMMRPEGFKPDEVVKSFEVRPWDAAANRWLVLLAVDGCAPLDKRPPIEVGDVPSLWLAIVHLPPAPARPALLARPVGGFLQAREHTVHRYALGDGPIAMGPGKRAFVVSHAFTVPFAGGGADVTVDHVFWFRQGDLALVFSAVSSYDAMYGGDWHEDGSRDHPEEHVSLTWAVTRKVTKGFFDLRMREAAAGPKGRRSSYTWQGDGYITGAEDFFPNQQMCLENGALTSPPEAWRKQWLEGELERLLAAGDVEGVMGLAVAHQESVRQAGGLLDESGRARILTLAHQSALACYRTDPARALRLLGYGICQWSSPQGIEARAVETDPPLFEALLQVTDLKAAAPLNDYAFILGKDRRHASEATSLLRAVLTLDPERRVAHLNLADLLWSRGKKDEARRHYRRYLDLSGAAATDVPGILRRLGSRSLTSPRSPLASPSEAGLRSPAKRERGDKGVRRGR